MHTDQLQHFTFSILFLLGLNACQAPKPEKLNLWQVYDQYLAEAKYVDLTNSFSPDIPVWPGFENARFMPAVAGKDIEGYVSRGDTFSLDKHGFIATSYFLPTDQYGTQLDPPAHWNPKGATISDLPPTYAVRPLVVLDIHEKVKQNPGYHAGIEDINDWEKKHGQIPAGSVVMVRSDWYKRWEDVDRYNQKPFPGVSLKALQFLHTERDILFHGHEALDTDTTANLEGEYWLLHNNYCQAEGVRALDQVQNRAHCCLSVLQNRKEEAEASHAILPSAHPIGNMVAMSLRLPVLPCRPIQKTS